MVKSKLISSSLWEGLSTSPIKKLVPYVLSIFTKIDEVLVNISFFFVNEQELELSQIPERDPDLFNIII